MKPDKSPVDRQTRMAAVVFADLVGFSKKSVPAQLGTKEALTALLTQLVTPYPKDGRAVLDTGDGAAVGFLVSPEFALGLALRLRRELVKAPAGALLQSNDLRLGINLGPLKVVTDVNGQPNMVGEGINSAERIMSFAEPGQTTASRSFQEAVYYLDPSFQSLFEPLGMRADKHGREHEVFRVTDSTLAINTALQSLDAGVAAQGQRGRSTLGRPAGVAAVAAGIAAIAVVAVAAWLAWPSRPTPPATSAKPPETVARPAPVAPAPPARPEPAPAPVATTPAPVGEAGGASAAPSGMSSGSVAGPAPASTTSPDASTAATPSRAATPDGATRVPTAAPPPPAAGAASAPAKPVPPPAKPRVAKPKSALAGAPTPVAPTTSARVEGARALSPRCALLLQRATLGETLTPAEQHELMTSCR